jgi:protein TonB
MRKWRSASGAVAWKLLLGIALGVGAVWFVAQSSFAPPEPVSREVAGPIGRTVVPNTEAPVATALAAPQRDTQNDPFAGVDLSNNSVLRHIAGIEEKTRGRQRAQARGTAVAAAPTATPETARPSASPPPPARQESTATQRPAPPVPVQTVAPPPSPSETPRGPAVLQTSAAVDAPVLRSASETTAASPPSFERVASNGVAAAPSAVSDRALVAALGNAPPPSPATTAPLHVIARTVPPFPIEAMRAGIREGRVVARLTIEADGSVSAAQIISSSPLGYFERESRRALATWRYEPPGRQTSADVELVFNRE